MQTEEQDKSLHMQLDEEEISTPSEKEFRVIGVKMIQDLGQRLKAWLQKTQQKFNKEPEGLMD